MIINIIYLPNKYKINLFNYLSLKSSKVGAKILRTPNLDKTDGIR